MRRKVLDHLGLYTFGDWVALVLIFVLAGVVAVACSAWFHSWAW